MTTPCTNILLLPQGLPGEAPPPLGVGDTLALPDGSELGTPLGVNANGGSAVRLYLGPNDSILYTIATTQPIIAPTVTWALLGSRASQKDEPISGVDIFILSKSGNPGYRIM